MPQLTWRFSIVTPAAMNQRWIAQPKLLLPKLKNCLLSSRQNWSMIYWRAYWRRLSRRLKRRGGQKLVIGSTPTKAVTWRPTLRRTYLPDSAKNSVLLTEAAVRDLEIATTWYEAQQPGLGRQLLDDIEATKSLISRHPQAWSPIDGCTRRCRARLFPYFLVYRIFDDHIAVLAIAHTSRHPQKWRSRLKSAAKPAT
jgi:toxin ParE1/3/4